MAWSPKSHSRDVRLPTAHAQLCLGSTWNTLHFLQKDFHPPKYWKTNKDVSNIKYHRNFASILTVALSTIAIRSRSASLWTVEGPKGSILDQDLQRRPISSIFHQISVYRWFYSSSNSSIILQKPARFSWWALWYPLYVIVCLHGHNQGDLGKMRLSVPIST